LGTAAIRTSTGLTVGALVAVNAFGHIVEPNSGRIIAGARKPGGGFADTVAAAQSLVGQTIAGLRRGNTTLAVVATNAQLDKAGVTKVAQMAQDGLARTIRPAHTHFDGDAVFALARGNKRADLSLVGALAADVLASAVVRAIGAAESLHGIPAAGDRKE
jgi:L-aminopeptidase/D-esterase-like protein